jgi:hypothetical protein
MPTDISKMDITELKAIGYDLNLKLNEIQNDLHVINMRIREKQSPTVSPRVMQDILSQPKEEKDGKK